MKFVQYIRFRIHIITYCVTSDTTSRLQCFVLTTLASAVLTVHFQIPAEMTKTFCQYKFEVQVKVENVWIWVPKILYFQATPYIYPLTCFLAIQYLSISLSCYVGQMVKYHKRRMIVSEWKNYSGPGPSFPQIFPILGPGNWDLVAVELCVTVRGDQSFVHTCHTYVLFVSYRSDSVSALCLNMEEKILVEFYQSHSEPLNMKLTKSDGSRRFWIIPIFQISSFHHKLRK